MIAAHDSAQSAWAHPFDALAADYDSVFTSSRLGRWLRESVRSYLAHAFPPGSRVLELGCGTGEDAVWLARRGVEVLASDASPEMLAVARRKAEAAGLAAQVSFARLDLNDLQVSSSKFHAAGGEQSVFDGAFSNFGALNCAADRRRIAEALAERIRPGGLVVLVLMGPLCAWELCWHLLHGEARTAVRRFRSGGSAHLRDGASVAVWYPTPRRLRAEFGPWFVHCETAAVGALLPPSQLAHLVDRWPMLFGTLALLERRLCSLAPSSWIADHFLIVFERR